MSEFRKALEKYAKYVIQQSRTNLTKKKNNSTKALYNSLEYKIQGDKVSFLSEKYGPFIDKGVRGAKGYYADQATAESPYKYTTKIPPAKPFEKWIKKNNIQGRDKKTGRFISHMSLAFIIGRKIKRDGIKGLSFFQKPLGLGLKQFGKDLLGNVKQDIIDTLNKTTVN
jgi:hypothetical protein